MKRTKRTTRRGKKSRRGKREEEGVCCDQQECETEEHQFGVCLPKRQANKRRQRRKEDRMRKRKQRKKERQTSSKENIFGETKRGNKRVL
jgi:hypothetical protein